MPGDESGAPSDRIDFDAFCRDNYAALRRAFRSARSLGIEPREVAHDAILRASEVYTSFASDTELLMWCKVVGINLIRDYARSGYKQREQPHPDPRSPSNNPEDVAIDNLELARTLAGLREADRRILRLQAEDYGRDEIAAILGISPASVGKLLQRARDNARKGWGKIVAALTPAWGGWLLRKAHRAASTPPLVVSIATASLVAALVYPGGANLSATHPSVGPATGSVARTAHLIIESPTTSLPAGKKTMSRPGVNSRAGTPHRHTPSKKRIAVPPVPGACTSDFCVGPCTDDEQFTGDRVYVKATGECGYGVAEKATPVCEDVPDNPALGCKRTGDPQWPIGPPPRPVPKGEPL